MSRWQTSLIKPLSLSGKGLHTGRLVTLLIRPAKPNSGIRFFRRDISLTRFVLANPSEISGTDLATTIGEGSRSVATVEHLMAAFAGLGLTNTEVLVDAPEVPIMDGSAREFVSGLMRCGLIEYPAPARAYRLKQPLTVSEGDKVLHLEPAKSQKIHCSIDFSSSVIGRQSIDYEAGIDNFLAIADARTFCHARDVQAMRERGLALGGSLENAVVVTEHGFLNAGGLRSPDEFVRHKLLNLLGDFALLGAPLMASLYAHKTGHRIHAQALQKLWNDKDFYLEEFYPEETYLLRGKSIFSPSFIHTA